MDRRFGGEVPTRLKKLCKRIENELIRLAISAGVRRTVVANAFYIDSRRRNGTPGLESESCCVSV